MQALLSIVCVTSIEDLNAIMIHRQWRIAKGDSCAEGKYKKFGLIGLTHCV